MANIHLTHRALKDIQNIHDYSTEEWGKKRADQYIDDLQSALTLLEHSPKLLKINTQISNVFVTYNTQRHWLICDTVKDDIYVLTVKHISMNLLDRLKDLQPTLEQEAKILSNRLKK